MSRIPLRLRNGLAMVPWGFVGLLVLIVVVERFTARYDVKFTPMAPAMWKQAASRVRMAARADVVCFGDSMVLGGMAPSVLEQRHGLKACNLAVPAGIMPPAYFLLDRLFRAGAKPKAILLDCELLSHHPFETLRCWSEMARASEIVDLAWTSRNADLMARPLISRWLVTYRARPDIRECIAAAIHGRLATEPARLAPLWRNLNINQGAFVLADKDTDTSSQYERLCKQVVSMSSMWAEWRCDPINDAYVRRILDRAESRGVPVYWLIPPVFEGFQAFREQTHLDAAYVDYVRRLQKRYPHMTVVDGRHAQYPPALMSDIIHLNRTGAIYFSDAVGALVREPSASRWRELPRYAEALSADLVAHCSGIEDIDESGRHFGPRHEAVASQVAGDAARRK